MKRFRDYEPGQTWLLPPSLRDWLPEGHLAHFIDEVVQGLDLSAVYAEYRELRGQPPYNPGMMVKVWLYAYAVGLRSSRKVERALQEDVGFRLLSANQQPKFWALNDFRSRHGRALGELFVQSVRLAERAGLVKLRHVAIDGTKLKANASVHSAMSYARMEEEEERLRAEIERYLRECDEVDREEDERFGSRRRGDELPEGLSTRRKRLEAIRKAKAELEREVRERARQEQRKRRSEAEAAGREFKPRTDPDQVNPSPKAQRNFTDPDSRIMPDSNKAYIQAYNGQLAVDAASQVVLAAELTNQAADAPHLPALLDELLANTGRAPREVSADAGYWSEDNLGAIAAVQSEAFIPPGQSETQRVAQPAAGTRAHSQEGDTGGPDAP